ncbi:hypothetical protein [Pseudorhodoplanes sp.]|uniref:hypothetical protein n=1 Tax=Pseudorhodoplanes sp. TaxID=1934341 RepID=UPI003D0DBBB5
MIRSLQSWIFDPQMPHPAHQPIEAVHAHPVRRLRILPPFPASPDLASAAAIEKPV